MAKFFSILFLTVLPVAILGNLRRQPLQLEGINLRSPNGRSLQENAVPELKGKLNAYAIGSRIFEYQDGTEPRCVRRNDHGIGDCEYGTNELHWILRHYANFDEEGHFRITDVRTGECLTEPQGNLELYLFEDCSEELNDRQVFFIKERPDIHELRTVEVGGVEVRNAASNKCLTNHITGLGEGGMELRNWECSDSAEDRAHRTTLQLWIFTAQKYSGNIEMFNTDGLDGLTLPDPFVVDLDQIETPMFSSNIPLVLASDTPEGQRCFNINFDIDSCMIPQAVVTWTFSSLAHLGGDGANYYSISSINGMQETFCLTLSDTGTLTMDLCDDSVSKSQLWHVQLVEDSDSLYALTNIKDQSKCLVADSSGPTLCLSVANCVQKVPKQQFVIERYEGEEFVIGGCFLQDVFSNLTRFQRRQLNGLQYTTITDDNQTLLTFDYMKNCNGFVLSSRESVADLMEQGLIERLEEGATCQDSVSMQTPQERYTLSAYGRGAGQPIQLSCREGEELVGLLCMPRCRDDYYGVLNVCWRRCPSGYADHGATCFRHLFSWHFKSTYGRGFGRAADNGCAEGLDLWGGICYPRCDEGFNGVGPVCWENCPESHPHRLGNWCYVDETLRNSIIGAIVGGVTAGVIVITVAAAAVVLTAGAALAPISAAKAAASAGSGTLAAGASVSLGSAVITPVSSLTISGSIAAGGTIAGGSLAAGVSAGLAASATSAAISAGVSAGLKGALLTAGTAFLTGLPTGIISSSIVDNAREDQDLSALGDQLVQLGEFCADLSNRT